MSDSLLTRYRPLNFDEVLGQDAAVASLRKAIESRAGRAFLFTGPSGVGKTTLARIAATELGCSQLNLTEIDAATHTGIDDMRTFASQLATRPFGDDAAKAVIVDECHSLSAQAWRSLLKSIEEPKPWGYWMFCTTEPARVPDSIRTRCLRYDLKLLDEAMLGELLTVVADAEGLKLDEKIVWLCASEARGSPRQAIANLGVCAAAGTRAEAAELLRTAADSPQAVDLARALVAGKSWREMRNLVTAMDGIDPESVRRVVAAYIEKVVSNADSEQAFGRGCEILSAFGQPFYSGEGRRPLYVAIAKLTLG